MRISGALLLLVCGTALAQDPSLAVVEACRDRLDARRDVGLDRIEKRCPELIPAIERAPWRNLVPSDLRSRRDELSAESLRALVELVRAAEREVASREAPRLERLAPVLAELGEQGQQGASRWERFKRWLKSKYERRKPAENEDSWRNRLRRQFQTSEGVAQAITYVGYALMTALVLLVIWSELRAAGLLRRRRREAPRGFARGGPWRPRLTLADVAGAPLRDRPGLLLKLLGEALTRADRLPAADGLTASELARRARLEDGDDREALVSLSRIAEVARYAPEPPSPETLEDAERSGRGLLGKFAPRERRR
jgi:hypothetical protein